ncbi:MAG TPA: hypothetical protein VM888_13955 [Chitinophagaceae bacterium]|nr:hypothetical protein [Chitinophagaceae bacterium]
MRVILTVMLCVAAFFCRAQTVHTPIAAVYTGLGAYSTAHTNTFSFTRNQAAIANTKNISLGVYGEKRFMLQNLGLYQFAAIVPTTSGNFGLKGGYFGGPDYNEAQIGLAYGRNLGSKVSVGAQFNYNSFRINTYGNASSVNFEAGAIFHVTPQLHTGIHAYNPLGSKLGKNEEERLPSIYTFGLGYEPSEALLISAEIRKTEDLPIDVNAGLQYIIDKKIIANAGISSGTSTFYFGAGIVLKDFQIDAVATVHPQLGITPGIMLLFNGK